MIAASQPLSAALCAKIEYWMQKFPKAQQRSALIPALMEAQRAHGGYLSKALQQAVADYFGLPHAEVYEVASFYRLYNLKPVGKHHFSICTNLSCMLRGANELVDAVQDCLKVSAGNVTADGQFSFCEVECLAACDLAPAFRLNEQLYANFDAAEIQQLITTLKQQAEAN
jgi:NADH-quinone oxidoreductase subunit E